MPALSVVAPPFLAFCIPGDTGLDKLATSAEYWAVWPTTTEGSEDVTLMLWENAKLADAAVSSAKPKTLYIA